MQGSERSGAHAGSPKGGSSPPGRRGDRVPVGRDPRARPWHAPRESKGSHVCPGSRGVARTGLYTRGGLVVSRGGDPYSRANRVTRGVSCDWNRVNNPTLAIRKPRHTHTHTMCGLQTRVFRVRCVGYNHLYQSLLRMKRDQKIGCRSGFTNIASIPQLGKFSKILQYKCFLGVLIHILGRGIHFDTFQSLKLNIEKFVAN